MSYWDAAYVAKFYLDEPESDRVRALAEAEGEAEEKVVVQRWVVAQLEAWDLDT